MSEQKQSFMAELDQWIDNHVLYALADAYDTGKEDVIMDAGHEVRQKIRGKVLESYHNGQAAGPRTQRRPYAKR